MGEAAPKQPTADRIDELAEMWREEAKAIQYGEDEQTSRNQLAAKLAGAANVLNGAARRIRDLEGDDG